MTRRWRTLPGPLCAEVLETGDTNALPLILLHGFTQTRRSWDPFLDALDTIEQVPRPIIRIDLPGHGGSAHIAADIETTADLVAEVSGPGALCGYSMGGRIALHVALRHSDRVLRLVTIGATAGIIDPEERHRRRSADEDLANTIERVGTAAFLDDWLAQPMFAGLESTPADLEERRTNTASGLASSLRLAGTGTQQPQWTSLGNLSMPVLLLAGDQDIKFADLADQMASCIGSNASSRRIVGAGHSAHLEQPSAVAEAVHTFLS